MGGELNRQCCTAARPAAQPKAAAPQPASELVVNYVLTGLIAGANDGWAILNDGTSDQLLQVGDTLSGGEIITKITAQGAELEKDGLTALVGFVPAGSSAAPPGTQGAPLMTASNGGPPTNVAPLPPQVTFAPIIRPLPAITLNLKDFAGERMAQIFTRAGGIAETQLKDGTSALEILWVRNGLLYDRISLKQGDKITTINGQPIVQAQSSVDIFQALIQARSFEIELVRNNALRSLKIEVQDAA